MIYELDSDSDSDDVLEMQTPPSWLISPPSCYGPSRFLACTLDSSSSSDQSATLLRDDDHQTTAYVAPTILKTEDAHLGPLNATAETHEAIAEHNRHAELVGRAVEMETSARGIVGSFRHPGPL